MDAPQPPDPPAPPTPAADGSLVLHTTLLGDLVVPGGASRAAELQELAAQAAVYATRARGPGTRRAYRSAWSGYERWCRSLGREPLSGDADTLALYATACAGRGLSPPACASTSPPSRPPTAWPGWRWIRASRGWPWCSRVSPAATAPAPAGAPPRPARTRCG
ncbi:hypothetical protein WDZ11_22080 (plasmid) [Roseomonas mucosa]|uniref:hypothetical protein n=1 Tax=Roseomonas mucosa TaxID=207340 RepID=UPI0030CAC8AE